MARLDSAMEKARAIFNSHEHSYPIRGVYVLSRKYRVPVYISPMVLPSGLVPIPPELIRPFGTEEVVSLRSLSIHPFIKRRDSLDPYNFTVTHEGITAGLFTDIGEPCPNVIRHLRECHAAFLESNFDEIMLETGHYPPLLKRRISCQTGHLSNTQALELFRSLRSPQLSHLILSHLSEHNNPPSIVSALFAPHVNGTRIEIAPRYTKTPLFRIANH